MSNKSVSDQLTAMGLGFRDMCEIEGVEGACVVYAGFFSKALTAMKPDGDILGEEEKRVVCGWKRVEFWRWGKDSDTNDVRFKRIDPPADELPEGVERAIKNMPQTVAGKAFARMELRDFARAILQAAKEGKS